MINSNIFRAYDIRGNGYDITANVAYIFGVCFGRLIGSGSRVCIGMDGRESSVSLLTALVAGLEYVNVSATVLGLVPTPVLYFADVILKPDASIMITGSHNPADHNGFKIVLNGKPFCGEQIQDLGRKMQSTIDLEYSRNFDITNTKNEIKTQYVDTILDGIDIAASLKVVWDPGNGAACDVIKNLVSKLPNKNIVINGDVDSKFSGRGPDPSKKFALDKLIQIIKSEGYDIGIAFDGDADRIVAVTAEGNVLSGAQLFYIFAHDIIQKNPNGIVISDVKISQTFIDSLASQGGVPIIWKTGHSWIKQKMKAENALFAGEMSGHMFFNDRYYGYDDGIYSAVRLLEIISQQSSSLEILLNKVPQVSQIVETKIPVSDDQKFDIIEKIQHYAQQNNLDFIGIDGVRVMVQDGWWLIRASNTEAFLVMIYEGSTKEGFEIARFEAEKCIKSYVEYNCEI